MDNNLESDKWPDHCCVPAFVLRAVTHLANRHSEYSSLTARVLAAQTLGVRVPPWDPNPWLLPTSSSQSDWGTRPQRALELFSTLTKRLGLPGGRIEIKPINTIDFELYEPEVLKRQAVGAVVGIGFSYSDLVGDLPSHNSSSSGLQPYHLVRLTPIGADETVMTVKSPGFNWGYRGKILVFDDSEEIAPASCVLDWEKLIAACNRSNGAIWAVYPP